MLRWYAQGFFLSRTLGYDHSCWSDYPTSSIFRWFVCHKWKQRPSIFHLSRAIHLSVCWAFARGRRKETKETVLDTWALNLANFARHCLELFGWSWKSSLWTWKIWRNLKIWNQWIDSGFWLWIIWSWKLFWENQGLTPETRAVSGVTWQSRHKFVSISVGWNFRFR